MDAADFRAAVEAARAEELERLGSGALTLALAGGNRDRTTLLQRAADSEHAARNTFRAWAADATDPDVRDAFRAVADQEDEHLRRVLARLDGDYEPVDGGPLHAYLRGREDAVERIGAGMVGRPLVSLRTHARLIDFFADAGEARTAETFRDLRRETGAVIDDALALLAERCDDDADWERARMTAEYAITVAYDDYADALRGLDVDPARPD